MRIVTLNTWKNEGDYARRLRLMGEGLAALDADLVCLQECFSAAGHDTGAALSYATGLHLHAAPAREKLRPMEGRLVRSASGLAMLSKTPLRPAVLALPSDPLDGERIAQRADLTACGRPLRLLNLHLTHLRGPKASQLRGAQLLRALEWGCQDLSGALIVAGDLNATAADPELAVLGLSAAPSTMQGAREGDSPSAGAAIDHVHLQHAGGWRVAGRRTALDRADGAGWFPSDHAAVVLDLEPV
ncbi:MAG: endonuclease/exonuclease/phosphatase family protein [Pseudomonadota bacterium]|jgi:endonuclease/exonuclease/phosphatase family metal-dependent hydrolase